MEGLDADQQGFLDELIWDNIDLWAIHFYKAATDCGLNHAIDSVYSRKQHLGVSFDGDSFSGKEAFARLSLIKDAVVVIEGSWDGDSTGWLITLSAIVQTPSQRHPRYTAYELCDVRGLENQVERAVILGQKLAEVAGTQFHLTSVIEYPTVRWWDTQPN